MSKVAIWVTVGVVVIVGALVVLAVTIPRVVEKSGFIEKQMDMMAMSSIQFAAGQIEMYRLRHGEYPERLGDIELVGDFGRSLIMAVRYHTNEDRTLYYLSYETMPGMAVQLEWPEGYWDGTGYSEALKPSAVEQP